MIRGSMRFGGHLRKINIQNKIRTLRVYQGISQAGLAELINTSQQQIARWENGQNISVYYAYAIAHALGVRIQDVFPFTVELESPQIQDQNDSETTTMDDQAFVIATKVQVALMPLIAQLSTRIAELESKLDKT